MLCLRLERDFLGLQTNLLVLRWHHVQHVISSIWLIYGYTRSKEHVGMSSFVVVVSRRRYVVVRRCSLSTLFIVVDIAVVVRHRRRRLLFVIVVVCRLADCYVPLSMTHPG